MNNRKTTKKALLMSALSLLLCFSMLIGTTFAWFTDSVESGVNQIIAGNLDVELYHADKAAPNGEKVTPNIKLFDDVTLWEPGALAYEMLTVQNEGTLALKYQLSINFANATKTEDGKTLAGVLKVAVVDAQKLTSREAAIEAAEDKWQALESFVLPGTLEGKTENNVDSDIYGIVIYWEPTDNDNDYNVKGGLSIDLGVKLVATQLTAEEDSFGSDYDEDAWAEGWKVNDAQGLQAAINNGKTEIILEEDIEVDEPIIIPAASTTFSLRTTPAIKINLNGKTITTVYNEETKKHAYAIDNYGNVEIYGGTIKARGIYNQEGATLTVNGTKIVNLDTNGGSCVWSYGGSVVLNNAELIGYTGCVYSDGYLEINGGTYTCYSAVLDDGTQLIPTYNIRSNGELVINGGDFTSRHGLVSVKGSAVINGGTYTMTSIGTITSHVFYVWGTDSNVTVNGGTFNCDLRTAQANGSSMICVDATNVTVAVKGGTFNLTPAKYVASGYKAVDNGGVYVVAPENVNAVILTAADLLALSAKAFTGNNGQAESYTIMLGANIDMNGADFSAMIAQRGDTLNFIGNGYTISNVNIISGADDNTTGQASMFYAYPNSTLNVSDLILKNITVTSDADAAGYAAAVIGYGEGAVVLKNVDVVNATVNGAKSSGLLVGHLSGSLTATDCDVAGKVTLSDYEANGHYAGEYIGTIAGNTTLNNCTANVTLGGNLKSSNVGVVYGRKVSGNLTINGAHFVVSADELAAAVQNGVTNLYLAPGEYNVNNCGGKTLTISGSKNAVLKIMNEGEDGCDYGFDGSDVTFNGVTIDTTANTGNYKGYARMTATFNDCAFIGGGYTTFNTQTFNNCTFDIAGYIWTWGATEVTFNKCAFVGDGRAILAHGSASTVITIKDCNFAATTQGKTWSGDVTAAVEIDPTGSNTYTIIFEGENTITENYSGWTRVKDGSTGHTIEGLN